MPRKCVNRSCKKAAILKRPKTEPEVLPDEPILNPKRPKKYATGYATEDLEKAVDAVQNGGMSKTAAAKKFSIPRSTLKGYVNGKSKLGVKPGRRRSIPEDIENALVDEAITAANSGFPLTRKEFTSRIVRIIKEQKLITLFKNGVPGKDYWKALQERRPDIIPAIRLTDKCHIDLKKKLETDCVKKYFDDLDRLQTELDVVNKPNCIWNASQLGMQYCSEPVKLVTKRSLQDFASKPGINKVANEALICVSAAGQAMPPSFVVEGKNEKSFEIFEQQSSTQCGGSFWNVHSNPYYGNKMLQQWFRDVFLECCGADRPQLLIMDNHGSQEMIDLLSMAKEENIYIFSIPPRSSPWLEPLDRGIFLTFQQTIRRHALKFMIDNPSAVIDANSWRTLLCQVWQEIMTPNLIINSFEITGLFPVDMNKIPPNALSTINKSANSTSVSTSIFKRRAQTTSIIIVNNQNMPSASSQPESFQTHSDGDNEETSVATQSISTLNFEQNLETPLSQIFKS